jgi:hypothetical protein
MTPEEFEKRTTIPSDMLTLLKEKQEEILAQISYYQVTANTLHVAATMRAEKSKNKGRTERSLEIGDKVLIKVPNKFVKFNSWCKLGKIIQKDQKQNAFVVKFLYTGGWLKKHKLLTEELILEQNLKICPLGVEDQLQRYQVDESNELEGKF